MQALTPCGIGHSLTGHNLTRCHQQCNANTEVRHARGLPVSVAVTLEVNVIGTIVFSSLNPNSNVYVYIKKELYIFLDTKYMYKSKSDRISDPPG